VDLSVWQLKAAGNMFTNPRENFDFVDIHFGLWFGLNEED